MWVLAGVAGLLVIGSIAGCGETKSDQTRTAVETSASSENAAHPVKFDVSAPSTTSKTLHRNEMVVRGTAEPGTVIQVNGRAITLNHLGRWRKAIKLELGDNPVELKASKAGMIGVTQSLTLTRKRSAAERAALRERQRIAREQRAAAARAAKIAREQAFRASAVTIPYKQLNKNADSFAGTKAKFYGEIFQIQEDGSGGGIMLLSVTHDDYLDLWDDHIWVDYDHSVQGAEGDLLTVYGTITGSKSYDTQIGGETYVPRM